MAYDYVALKVSGKRIDEHRLVWEQHNGPIPPGHVIHHIDENKSNNDIANLACMSLSEHTRLHTTGKTMDDKHKAKLMATNAALTLERHTKHPIGYKECCSCKLVLEHINFTKNKNKWDGLHSSCRSCRSISRSKKTNTAG